MLGAFEREQLAKRLRALFEKDWGLAQAMLAANRNSRNGLWLIGGTVFRRLAHITHQSFVPEKGDYDFLVGDLVQPVYVPEGWTLGFNAFGNPKLKSPEGIVVDLCPLRLVHSILRRKVTPTIQNWEIGTPLNVQAVAFDCASCELVGDIGAEAAYQGVVAVNDPIQAGIYAARKKKPIGDIVKTLACELNYKTEIPT